MASSAKRLWVEESDSDDSENSFKLIEETPGGMESGEECAPDHLLADEISR